MTMNQRRINQLLGRIETQELREVVSECLNFASQYRDGSTRNIGSQIERIFSRRIKSNLFAPAEKFTSCSEEAILQNLREETTTRSKSSYESIIFFERLELNDFGTFRGQHQADLTTTEERPVVIFVGENGAGKSTTFHGLNFALYGERYINSFKPGPNPPGIDFINDYEYNKKIALGLPAEASVTLHFRVSEKRYRVTRTLISPGIKSNNIPASVRTDFAEFKESGNYESRPPSTIPVVLQQMPESIREFFLFDGERATEFASTTDSDSTQSAMQQALGISDLEMLTKDVLQLKDSLARDVNRKVKGQKQIQDQVLAAEETSKKLAQLTNDIENIQNNIEANKKSIQRIDSTLQANKETREKQQYRIQVQKQFKEAEEQEHERLITVKKTLPKTAQQLGMRAVGNLSERLAELTGSGVLTGGIHQKFVDDLLAAEKCICGRPLSEHDEQERNALHGLIDLLRAQDRPSENITQLYHDSRWLLDDLPGRYSELAGRIKDYDLARKARANAFHSLQELNEQLADDEQFNSAGFEEKLANFNKDNEKLNQELGGKQLEQKNLQETLKALQKQIDAASESDQEARRLRELRDWADVTHECLDAFVNELSLTLRLETAIRTEMLWHDILPNVDRYQVLIKEDFTIDVVTPEGDRALQRLSGGQQQCLGLAFIASVSHTTNTLPPLTIDNPFGKLDDSVTSEVAMALPELTSQLILFLLQGKQWEENIQRTLQTKASRITEIVRNEENISRFVEGGSV